jgi:hypothetical protein
MVHLLMRAMDAVRTGIAGIESPGTAFSLDDRKESPMLASARTFVAAALLAGGAVLVAVRHTQAADGTPDLTGTWTGSAKVREFYLDPGQKNGRDKFDFSLVITQTGADVSADATLTNDEGVQTFTLVGKVGQRSMWAVNADNANPFLVSLHVDKKTRKLTGVGVYSTAAESEELTFKLTK